MTPLDALEAAIAEHLRFVHERAGGSPAGGGPAWDALLAHYGVAGVGPGERAAVVRGLGLSRGATPGEVRLVFVALARWAEGELGRTGAGADPRSGGLAQRLRTLADTETARYEQAVGLPPPAPPPPAQAPKAPSVASIFGNAAQTAQEVPWAGREYESAATLTCNSCGAPQQRAGSFICLFCRRPIAGPTG